jgi:hypothetical protein
MLDVWRMATDHMAHVQFGHFVVAEIEGPEAMGTQGREQRGTLLPILPTTRARGTRADSFSSSSNGESLIPVVPSNPLSVWSSCTAGHTSADHHLHAGHLRERCAPFRSRNDRSQRARAYPYVPVEHTGEFLTA